MPDPAGVLVLDDLVGMFGADNAAELAAPFLRRVSEVFSGLAGLFHNDRPNVDVFETLRGYGIDAFNFSREIDALDARRRLGPDIVLSGNLPPLDLLVHGSPAACRDAAARLIERWPDAAPMILSAGGGVSPGTPVANLKAAMDAVRAAGRRSTSSKTTAASGKLMT